jgi:hypothetical protein
MNIWEIILLIFAFIVILVVVYGFSRPRKSYIFRTIEVKSSPEKVFEQTNSLQHFVKNWSPWTARDENAVHEYNDIIEGVGASYKWKGHPKKVGYGEMEIIAVKENESVTSKLYFGGRGDAIVTLSITPINNEKVNVKWDFTSDSGNNPVSRIFGSLMDKFLGPDYELGLKKLKTFCENN